MHPSLPTRRTVFALAIIVLAGCDVAEKTVDGRWYTAAQISTGQAVFRTHCAGCHGAQAKGLAANWKQRTADGSFPPPPLNGTAHAWHHPRSVLVRTINVGGIPLGGKMPGFKGKLSDDEILSVIAYIQSLWPQDIYTQWQKLGGADG